MLLKAGVDISRLKRPIRRVLGIADGMLNQEGEELVVTSTYEGDHIPSSLHYSDEAFDSRKPRVNEVGFVLQLRQRLGKNYDIVLYQNHIHYEYDPKKEGE